MSSPIEKSSRYTPILYYVPKSREKEDNPLL